MLIDLNNGNVGAVTYNQKLTSPKFFKANSTDIRGTTLADITSDSIDMRKYNGPWLLSLFGTISGSPTVTIQHSYNGTDWEDYLQTTIGVTFPVSFLRQNFFPNYIRIVVVKGTASGTFTAVLNLVDIRV